MRSELIKRPWNNPKGQLEFLRKCVIEKKLHPEDFAILFEKKFGFSRTPHSFIRKLHMEGISYAHTLPKRKQVTKRVARVEAREDVKLVSVQQKLKNVTAKYNAIIQEESLGGRLIRVLKDEAKALPEAKCEMRFSKDKITEETAVLLFGDTHIGETVEKEAVAGFGEYNFDIYAKRTKFLCNSITDITKRKLRGYRIKKLVIFGMGDMVSGRIHDELIETGEDVIFQILNGAYIAAQFVLELQKLFPVIEIAGVLGNHGRLTKRVSFKKRYTNWDYVFYQFMSVFLANNKNIECLFPKSFFLVKEIEGWNFLALHGDSIKSWMGIPWYGIERAMWRLGDLLQSKEINIDYRILGHFHNTGELDRRPGEIIINGSMMGGSEFSLMAMFSFDRPTQLFFGVHKEKGATWRYPIRLDLPGVEEVEPYAYTRELDAGKYMKELLSK